MTALGIIESVEVADWVAPIVPVLKPDKTSVRICRDFTMTVNQTAKLDRYPIPKVEDATGTTLITVIQGAESTSYTRIEGILLAIRYRH